MIGQNSLLQTRADIAAGNLQYDPSTTYISLIVGDGDNIAFMKGGRRGWMNERVEYCRSQPGARWILVSDWSAMRLFLNTWLWLVNYQFSTKYWPVIGLISNVSNYQILNSDWWKTGLITKYWSLIGPGAPHLSCSPCLPTWLTWLRTGFTGIINKQTSLVLMCLLCPRVVTCTLTQVKIIRHD